MRFKDCVIHSVGEMLSKLKTQSKSTHITWFRGQSSSKWKLVPSLARKIGHLTAESAYIKKFMQNAMPYIDTPPTSEWEWIFLMQHYRAATRLLDWSESPLAALYFAVHESKLTRTDGAVWCLDPVALNREAKLKFSFEFEIPAFGQDSVLDSYLPSRVNGTTAELFPVAIIGPRNTPRMAAQLGTFTINHRIHTPIEEIGVKKHVWRWIIPARSKKSMMNELSLLGYSALTLFPELDRVADHSRRLLDEI